MRKKFLIALTAALAVSTVPTPAISSVQAAEYSDTNNTEDSEMSWEDLFAQYIIDSYDESKDAGCIYTNGDEDVEPPETNTQDPLTALANNTVKEKASNKETGNVSVAEFYTMLQNKLDVSDAVLNLIIKKAEVGDKTSKDIYVTNERAALIADAADEYINGGNYSNSKLEKVKKYKRISDISASANDARNEIYRCYTKGIMVGRSNGQFSQDRSFSPKAWPNKTECEAIIKRIGNKTMRYKLSPDGQVTRTTNLPKTAKRYKYILASFPNSYYDAKMIYTAIKEKTVNGKPYTDKYLRDYFWPKDIGKIELQSRQFSKETIKATKYYEQYGDEIFGRIKKNLELRFNFDYRTSGKKWRQQLSETYYEKAVADAEDKKIVNDYFAKYMAKAKKNQVIIKSSKVVVEPSSMYFYQDGLWIRCYVRFKCSAKNFHSVKSYKQNELIASMADVVRINMKNNTWCDAYFDVSLSGGITPGGQYVSDGYGLVQTTTKKVY